MMKSVYSGSLILEQLTKHFISAEIKNSKILFSHVLNLILEEECHQKKLSNTLGLKSTANRLHHQSQQNSLPNGSTSDKEKKTSIKLRIINILLWEMKLRSPLWLFRILSNCIKSKWVGKKVLGLCLKKSGMKLNHTCHILKQERDKLALTISLILILQ